MPTMNGRYIQFKQLIRVFTLAVCVGSFAPAAVHAETPAQNPEPVEGRWYGMAGFPQDRVELGFEFKRNDKGELKAYLYEPVLNFYGLELPGAVLRDGDKYTLPSYALEMTLQAGEVKGSYLGIYVPFELHRTEKLPSEVPVPDLPKGPGPRWMTKLGSPIYAPVAVRDGIAYIGTTGGLFHAIDVKDGSFAWTFAAGRPTYGEALVTGNAVYFVCDNGFLFKLDRQTGKEIWRYDLDDARISRIMPHQQVANSGEDFDFDHTAPRPLFADGVLYVGSGSGFHAVDADTGRRVWRIDTKDKVRTDALISGSNVIFGSFDNYVYAIDSKTGKEVWNKNTYGPITSPPALIDNKLMVGNRNGLLVALDPVTAKVLWKMVFWASSVESPAVPDKDSRFFIGSSDLRRISLIDSKDGTVLWRTDVFGWAWPRVALTNDRLFAATAGADPHDIRQLGGLVAMDRKNGKILWRWPMPESPGSWMNGFVSAPAIDGDTLIVGGLDGSLYAFPVK
jgi:outer membrane protein assembly factor BamB